MDGVMDWIYDAELFVSSVVEGTYETVKERTDRLEVNASFCAATFACPFVSCCYERLAVKRSLCVIRERFDFIV